MANEIGGGIISPEEEGGGLKNVEGFTRFVFRLLLLSSGVSRRGIKGGGVDRGEGLCKVGTVGRVELIGRESGGTGEEDWKGPPAIPAFDAPPIVIAVLKKLTKDGSSGTSVTLEEDDDEGSSGPSITAIVGTASSSSNSLLVDGTFDFGGTLEYAFSILLKRFATSSHSRPL